MSTGLGRRTSDDARIEVGLHVRSADTSLAYYRDLIGCTVVTELDLEDRHLWVLRLGSSVLKLLEWDHTPAAVSPRGTAIGIRYITLHVDDVDATASACAAAGYALIKGPQSFNPEVRFCLLEDPDGNTVELISGRLW